MARLGIGQLTAIEVPPEEYIAIAAGTGCDQVSLLAMSPNPQMTFPLVTADNLDAVKAVLDRTGLGVGNVEVAMLTPQCDVESFRPGVEIGRELGAAGVTVILMDSDENDTVRNLRRMCAMARESGLRVNIEFMPLTPRWRTIGEAAELVQSLGEPGLGLGVDLLHVVRAGGTPADVAAVPQELIHYAQLCDGADLGVTADYAVEAGANRLAPGEGVFPLQSFLQALPAGIVLEIEVPQHPDRPALERVRAIVEATRRQLALAGLE